MDNWMKTSGIVLCGADYFPPLEAAGPHLAQMFKSSFSEGSESMRLMYLMAIHAAGHSLCIANAYFVPDDLTVKALADAVERGVEVQVLVPGAHIDARMVRRASRARWDARWEKLLEAGVRIYEYQPTMLHTKLMVVDDLWVSVGSTNFDNRSFRLNDEANLNVYDREFALAQHAVFARDLEQAKAFDHAAWKRRPWREKVLETAAGLFRSQL